MASAYEFFRNKVLNANNTVLRLQKVFLARSPSSIKTSLAALLEDRSRRSNILLCFSMKGDEYVKAFQSPAVTVPSSQETAVATNW
jgi:hypothetical protein